MFAGTQSAREASVKRKAGQDANRQPPREMLATCGRCLHRAKHVSAERFLPTTLEYFVDTLLSESERLLFACSKSATVKRLL